MTFHSCVMKQIVLSLLCLLALIPAAAQKIGDTSYRYIHGAGGSVDEISRSISGYLCPGKKLKSYPSGTIFEVKYIGRGYYATKPFDLDKEGILLGSWDISPDEADPRKGAGQMYKFEHYAVECPALGDEPDVNHYIEYGNNTFEPAKYGNVVVYYYEILNPGKSNQKQVNYKYYGTYLPYCVSVKWQDTGDKVIQIPELRIYTSFEKFSGKVTAIYCNGTRYNSTR